MGRRAARFGSRGKARHRSSPTWAPPSPRTFVRRRFRAASPVKPPGRLPPTLPSPSRSSPGPFPASEEGCACRTPVSSLDSPFPGERGPPPFCGGPLLPFRPDSTPLSHRARQDAPFWAEEARRTTHECPGSDLRELPEARPPRPSGLLPCLQSPKGHPIPRPSVLTKASSSKPSLPDSSRLGRSALEAYDLAPLPHPPSGPALRPLAIPALLLDRLEKASASARSPHLGRNAHRTRLFGGSSGAG